MKDKIAVIIGFVLIALVCVGTVFAVNCVVTMPEERCELVQDYAKELADAKMPLDNLPARVDVIYATKGEVWVLIEYAAYAGGGLEVPKAGVFNEYTSRYQVKLSGEFYYDKHGDWRIIDITSEIVYIEDGFLLREVKK